MDLILANANNDFILANASDDGQGIRLLMMVNKEFDYKEIISFTNNFKHEIVKGGFGRVYRGQMRDGKQVAVKILSHNLRGSNEFRTEVRNFYTSSHFAL